MTTKLARKCMLDKIMFLFIYLQFILYMITRESKIVLHEILSPWPKPETNYTVYIYEDIPIIELHW